MTKKIVAWDLVAVWDDKTIEQIDEVPEHIVKDVEYFLDLWQEERAKDENRE
jgi:hypothetical protein